MASYRPKQWHARKVLSSVPVVSAVALGGVTYLSPTSDNRSSVFYLMVPGGGHERGRYSGKVQNASPDTKLDMFLSLYFNDATDAAEVFFDSITAKADVAVRPQFVQSEQKLAIDKLFETARKEVNQIPGLSDVSIQNLHLMVMATIEKGFEDRLAERWRNPPPRYRKALKKRRRAAKLLTKRHSKK